MATARTSTSWTTEETRLLRELWATTHMPVLMEKLKKTKKAISSRAKVLGLRKAADYVRSPRVLTDDEVAFLRDNYLKYPNPVLSKMMGRGESTIQSYRRKLGIEGKENT